MEKQGFKEENQDLLNLLMSRHLSPFDLIPQADLREKLVELVLNGVPEYADYESSILLKELASNIRDQNVDNTRVVVFGGGTGLSNIIGGDCRQESWRASPFLGLKQVFPETKAVVCVTDDGGSTGELLKDMPLIAIGDIRHVLLSSIQEKRLAQLYNLDSEERTAAAYQLYQLFNYRYTEQIPESADQIIEESGAEFDRLPRAMAECIYRAVLYMFGNDALRNTIKRPHCLGNLIIASVLIKALEQSGSYPGMSEYKDKDAETCTQALSEFAEILGAARAGVLSCTFTPAQLRFLYTNGVEVCGEIKSSKAARGFPVDRVTVDFCGVPHVPQSIIDSIREADILIMAPGSLYSSIIPVLQVPGIAEAVRQNKRGLKLLIANLWVQAGETDRSISDPERKFHVSDMIKAYHRNLPGGTDGLFDQVLCLSLKDVPATVLQNYAVEGKIPIYLDKELLKAQGFTPVECGFFSRSALTERNVIQHDPQIVAQTVKTLYLGEKLLNNPNPGKIGESGKDYQIASRKVCLPSLRYSRIKDRVYSLPVSLSSTSGPVSETVAIKQTVSDILWDHKDIPVAHLDNVAGIVCVAVDDWRRDQRWDNVFSFYDPESRQINIRQDRFTTKRNLEISLLIALGQALLGNYAAEKTVEQVIIDGMISGNIFHLYLRDIHERYCYFNDLEIQEYLQLARLIRQNSKHFTRLINGDEGFTPPGLLMGVMYAWYLDNTFASHIEYKMSVLKVGTSDLIPEQLKMMKRREKLISFFRDAVFGKNVEMI